MVLKVPWAKWWFTTEINTISRFKGDHLISGGEIEYSTHTLRNQTDMIRKGEHLDTKIFTHLVCNSLLCGLFIRDPIVDCTGMGINHFRVAVCRSSNIKVGRGCAAWDWWWIFASKKCKYRNFQSHAQSENHLVSGSNLRHHSQHNSGYPTNGVCFPGNLCCFFSNLDLLPG